MVSKTVSLTHIFSNFSKNNINFYIEKKIYMWHLPTPVFVISTYTHFRNFCLSIFFFNCRKLKLVSYDDDCIRMGEKENNKTLPEYYIFFRTLESLKIPLLHLYLLFIVDV